MTEPVHCIHGALVHGPARRAERHTARLAELPRGAVTVVFGTRRAPLAHQASFRVVLSHLGFHGFRKCERDEHGVCKVLLESILLEWVDS